MVPHKIYASFSDSEYFLMKCFDIRITITKKRIYTKSVIIPCERLFQNTFIVSAEEFSVDSLLEVAIIKEMTKDVARDITSVDVSTSKRLKCSRSIFSSIVNFNIKIITIMINGHMYSILFRAILFTYYKYIFLILTENEKFVTCFRWNTTNNFIISTPPRRTTSGVFIYLNEKGGVLHHVPAIGLAFSISQRRRFLGG